MVIMLKILLLLLLLSGVPSYHWIYGCSPTAAGMLLGYYDSHGYPNLVEGAAYTQTEAVNEMIH